MSDDSLTTAEAATELGVGADRIRKMIASGRLATNGKHGREWKIPRAGLEAVRDRKSGNPHKVRPRKINPAGS